MSVGQQQECLDHLVRTAYKWVNYLGNAIKYGGQPPRLESGADTQPDGMICFWVRDNGPGLTLDAQAHSFQLTRCGGVAAV